mmetsp:Transcript_115094/g.245913  ORF Transcript_115094/g.245913 Transcript_115094/m.245913 type:complete len:279 (-) Transcript_115094:23-859(-)
MDDAPIADEASARRRSECHDSMSASPDKLIRVGVRGNNHTRTSLICVRPWQYVGAAILQGKISVHVDDVGIERVGRVRHGNLAMAVLVQGLHTSALLHHNSMHGSDQVAPAEDALHELLDDRPPGSLKGGNVSEDFPLGSQVRNQLPRAGPRRIVLRWTALHGHLGNLLCSRLVEESLLGRLHLDRTECVLDEAVAPPHEVTLQHCHVRRWLREIRVQRARSHLVQVLLDHPVPLGGGARVRPGSIIPLSIWDLDGCPCCHRKCLVPPRSAIRRYGLI